MNDYVSLLNTLLTFAVNFVNSDCGHIVIGVIVFACIVRLTLRVLVPFKD